MIEGKDLLDWWKYLAWTKGISPYEFRKCQKRDLKTIMEIEQVINQKKSREAAVKEAISKIKW